MEKNLFVLQYNEKNQIESVKLDLTDRPRAAAEILDQALGVSFTYPVWAEEDLNQIVQEFVKRPMNVDTVQEFSSRLDEKGLGQFFPQVLRGSFGEKE